MDPWKNDRANRGCAFVVTLYGDNPCYCLEAAVLGWSLKNTQTIHSMVCLYTDAVSKDWLQILRYEVGWDTREVKLLECNSLYDQNSQGGRFTGTFSCTRSGSRSSAR